MNAKQLHEEIKEMNLSYMMLAKQMINADKTDAICQLGISEETAELVSGLATAQMLKMASSNMMLCSFHFDESLLLNMITDYSKDSLMSRAPVSKTKRSAKPEAVAA